MELLELGVMTQRLHLDAALEKEIELFARRIGGCTAMPGNCEGTAGIGIFERLRPFLSVKPAFEEASEESVPRPQHIEHLDRKTGAGFALIQTVGDRPGKGDCSRCSALADKRRRCERADSAQGSNRVRRTAGDMELLFRAHDELEKRECALQPSGDRRAPDIAALARAMAGQPPQIGAIIDIERGLRTMRTGEL
jgi:hypothetical protein